MTTHQFVRAHPWLPWALAAACLVLAGAFAVLGAGVLHGAMVDVDRVVRDAVVEHRTSAGVRVAGVVSFIGATQWLAIVALAVGLLVLRRDRRPVLWAWFPLLIVCATVSSHLVDLLKDYFEIVRPPAGVLVRESLSFPSGHSAGSAAVSIFLAYVVARERRAPAVLAGALAIAVILLVGVSRMFLDFHWLSDVVGGWIVGTAVAVGFCSIWEWTQRYRRDVPKAAGSEPSPTRAVASAASVEGHPSSRT